MSDKTSAKNGKGEGYGSGSSEYKRDAAGKLWKRHVHTSTCGCTETYSQMYDSASDEDISDLPFPPLISGVEEDVPAEMPDDEIEEMPAETKSRSERELDTAALCRRLAGAWAAMDYAQDARNWMEVALNNNVITEEEAKIRLADMEIWSIKIVALEREDAAKLSTTDLQYDHHEWQTGATNYVRRQALEAFDKDEHVLCPCCRGPYHWSDSDMLCSVCKVSSSRRQLVWRGLFTKGFDERKSRVRMAIDLITAQSRTRLWPWFALNWLCSLSTITGTGIGVLFLGPWGLLFAIPAYLFGAFVSGPSLLLMAGVMGAIGMPGILWAVVLWTFVTASISGLVTYALARTLSSGKRQVQQGVTDEIGRAFNTAISFVPTLPHRTLSYMRNLVGLTKDIPLLAQSLVVFWRGLMFDPEKCEKGKVPTVYVWNLNGKYVLRGLSAFLTCGELAMAGYSFVRRGQNGDWVELEIEQISRAEVRSITGLVLVETLFWEDDNAMDNFETTQAKDAAYDVTKREMIERSKDPSLRRTPRKASGQKIVTYQTARHVLRAKKAMYRKALAREQKLGDEIKEYVRKLKAGEVPPPKTDRYARQLKRNYEAAKRRTVDLRGEKQEARTRLEAVAPDVADDLPDVEPSKGYCKKKQKFVPATPSVDEDKGKEKVKGEDEKVDDAKPSDLVEGILTVLGDSTDEKPQGHELDAAHNLGTMLRDWIHSGWSLVRVHWYIGVIIAMVSLLLIGFFAYFVVRYKRRQLSQAGPRKDKIVVAQGSILKYDVHPDDSIVKFMVDGHVFGYDEKRFNELAKGKPVGSLVSVPVVFAKGGARMISALVGEGETFQSFQDPKSLPKAHPLRRTDRYCRRREKARLLAEDDQSWKTVKRRFNFGIPSLCHYRQEETTHTEHVALTPVEKVLTERLAPLQEAQAGLHHKLVESEQAFKTARATACLYTVDNKNQFAATVVKVVKGLLMPRHFVNPAFGSENAASQLVHGQSVYLRSPMDITAAQMITWEKDRVLDPGDTDDAVVMPLAKPLTHMPMVQRMVVLPDGDYWMWAHGVDPDTRYPFQTRLRVLKKGKTLHYTMDNKQGICDAILCLDTDLDVLAGIHVRGNVSTKQCTASAITRKLAEVAGYTEPCRVTGVPGEVYTAPRAF